MSFLFFYSDQRKVDSARVGKELAQLKKNSRKKDNQIKSLQSDARRRELVLKRRQEEVHCMCYFNVYNFKYVLYYTCMCIMHVSNSVACSTSSTK